MQSKTVIIGTRGSQLALYQANRVKNNLERVHTDLSFELKIIHTKGDKILDTALSKIGDKGLFTKEIEVALEAGEIDMAVHSLKDLPTELEASFQIGAVLSRDNFRDALVTLNGKMLADLTSEDKVATSSLRRKAALLSYCPNLNIIDIRGNVNTRLKKLEEGYCDALIMAAAGLERLGLHRYITETLDPEIITPAVSQGVIAIETRNADNEILEILNPIHHKPTWEVVKAERVFMKTLQGGCQVPVGCYSKYKDNTYTIDGFVAEVDGKNVIKESLSGNMRDASDISEKLAIKILNQGGKAILDNIRN